MKKHYIIFLASTLLLVSCTSFNEERANQFQSLTQNQQAQYWQTKNVLRLIANLKNHGTTIYVQGDEYQIIIPASKLFKGNTPQTLASTNATLRPVVELINAQSTPSIQVLAYTHFSASKDRNFALTQSWAQTILDRLKQEGLMVALLSAKGHGECDNIGPSDFLNNRIEIHYRIDHDN